MNVVNNDIEALEPVEVVLPKKPIKVMLCIPSGRSWEARTSTSVAGLMVHSVINGIMIGIVNLEGSMITKQRCDVVEMALQQKPDYLMFIDSDMRFPPDSLLRLLAHKKDVVGATYNKRVPPYETLGRLKPPRPSDEELAKGGLYPAEQLPGGMVLIHASVFERLKWPWFFETYQWPGENGVEAFKEMLRSSYSEIPPDEVLNSIEGTPLGNWLNELHPKENVSAWRFLSEDLQFCRKCAKAGIEIHADLSLTFDVVHLGILEVTCVPQATSPKESAITAAVM